MRRMPIPVRISPFLCRGCPRQIYAVLASLSEGCTPDRGRLHTCYSPVRHSPAERASSFPAAVRLACVKPAASVHPEPGSNSPLLVIYLYIYIFKVLFVPDFLVSDGIVRRKPRIVRVPLSLHFYASTRHTLLVLWHHVIVLFRFATVFTPQGFHCCAPVVSRLRLQNYCLFRPCANFSATFLQFPRFSLPNSL